jgi:nicotinate-nucleotide pyrophosphorylase (carboxylating)
MDKHTIEDQHLNALIDAALAEDITDIYGMIPTGDHSSLACIPDIKDGRAQLLVKANGVLAGVALAKRIFARVDDNLLFEDRLEDGTNIRHGNIAFCVHGEVKSILRAERVVLNFMQRMSGIATNTKRYVAAVSGTNCKILDTRKTTPTLRYLEKWAVRIGGGYNHRYGLYDMIMLKDNHIDFSGGIVPAIEAVTRYQQENNLKLKVEVEARTLADVELIVKTGGVDRVMFDNFSHEEAREAVLIAQGKLETEISGGITLDTILPYAETGVDYISVGALTHSSTSLDLSLKAF